MGILEKIKNKLSGKDKNTKLKSDNHLNSINSKHKLNPTLSDDSDSDDVIPRTFENVKNRRSRMVDSDSFIKKDDWSSPSLVDLLNQCFTQANSENSHYSDSDIFERGLLIFRDILKNIIDSSNSQSDLNRYVNAAKDFCLNTPLLLKIIIRRFESPGTILTEENIDVLKLKYKQLIQNFEGTLIYITQSINQTNYDSSHDLGRKKTSTSVEEKLPSHNTEYTQKQVQIGLTLEKLYSNVENLSKDDKRERSQALREVKTTLIGIYDDFINKPESDVQTLFDRYVSDHQIAPKRDSHDDESELDDEPLHVFRARTVITKLKELNIKDEDKENQDKINCVIGKLEKILVPKEYFNFTVNSK